MKLKVGAKTYISQDFFKNSIIHWFIIISFLLNFICWGVLLFFIRPVDFPIILHYNVYFGVDMIGDWWQAYFLPLITLIITLINTVLAYFFYKNKERIISYILLLASLLSQVGGAIAIGSIIRINY